MSIIRLCYLLPKFLILTEHFTQRWKISPGLVRYKRCLLHQRSSGTGCAGGSPGCDITAASSPHGPAGDTRAHDTRAATRGRGGRPERGHIPAGRRDGPGRASPRDARSPPCAGIQAKRGDGALDRAARPHPRGWRHIPARGSVSCTGGRRDAHTQGQTLSRKKAAASLGAAQGCLCLGDERWRGQGDTLGPPLPAWEGDTVTTLRGN